MIAELIKSSIVLVLTLFAVCLCRRRSAADRHLIWTAGLIAAVAVPFCGPLLPDWRPGVAAATAIPIELSQIEWVPSLAASGGEAAPATPHDRLTLPLVLWGVWFSGAALALLWRLAGMMRLRLLAFNAAPEHRWSRTVVEVSKTFGLKRPIRVFTGGDASMLGTWGVFRPCVLLPVAAATWPEERVRAVLTHELAHIQRHDWVVHAFAEAARAVFWINPLFWLACSRLKRESEHASDDAVLRSGFDGPTYAGHLLELARTLKTTNRSWQPFLAMARPPDLERRFVTILNPAVNRSAVTPVSIFVVAMVALALTLPVAAMRATAQNTGEPVLERVEAEEFTSSVAKVSIAPETPARGVISVQASQDSVIDAKDELMINVWRQPELTQRVVVRPDGKIALPLLGETQASGLRLGELQERITQGLRKYVNEPGVTVMLAEARAPAVPPVPRAAVPAQNPSGRLTGIVSDATGARVPGVAVFAGSASGQTQRTVSGEDGRFLFNGLADGQYVLQAQLPGFATFLSNAFTISGGQTTQIDVPLRIGSVSSMVQVSAANPVTSTTPSTDPPAAGQRAGRGENPPPASTQSRGAPQRLRIGGNIRAPRLLEHVRPVYPPELRNSGLEPSIIIEAVIGIDGRILSPRVISNSTGSPIDPLFVYAALDAVRQWRHSPAELNGEPVEIATTITVAFKR
jgi:TonB family protein